MGEPGGECSGSDEIVKVDSTEIKSRGLETSSSHKHHGACCLSDQQRKLGLKKKPHCICGKHEDSEESLETTSAEYKVGRIESGSDSSETFETSSYEEYRKVSQKESQADILDNANARISSQRGGESDSEPEEFEVRSEEGYGLRRIVFCYNGHRNLHIHGPKGQMRISPWLRLAVFPIVLFPLCHASLYYRYEEVDPEDYEVFRRHYSTDDYAWFLERINEPNVPKAAILRKLRHDIARSNRGLAERLFQTQMYRWKAFQNNDRHNPALLTMSQEARTIKRFLIDLEYNQRLSWLETCRLQNDLILAQPHQIRKELGASLNAFCVVGGRQLEGLAIPYCDPIAPEEDDSNTLYGPAGSQPVERTLLDERSIEDAHSEVNKHKHLSKLEIAKQREWLEELSKKLEESHHKSKKHLHQETNEAEKRIDEESEEDKAHKERNKELSRDEIEVLGDLCHRYIKKSHTEKKSHEEDDEYSRTELKQEENRRKHVLDDLKLANEDHRRAEEERKLQETVDKVEKKRDEDDFKQKLTDDHHDEHHTIKEVNRPYKNAARYDLPFLGPDENSVDPGKRLGSLDEATAQPYLLRRVSTNPQPYAGEIRTHGMPRKGGQINQRHRHILDPKQDELLTPSEATHPEVNKINKPLRDRHDPRVVERRDPRHHDLRVASMDYVNLKPEDPKHYSRKPSYKSISSERTTSHEYDDFAVKPHSNRKIHHDSPKIYQSSPSQQNYEAAPGYRARIHQGDAYGRPQHVTPNLRAPQGQTQRSTVVQRPEQEYNGYSANQSPFKEILDSRGKITRPPARHSNHQPKISDPRVKATKIITNPEPTADKKSQFRSLNVKRVLPTTERPDKISPGRSAGKTLKADPRIHKDIIPSQDFPASITDRSVRPELPREHQLNLVNGLDHTEPYPTAQHVKQSRKPAQRRPPHKLQRPKEKDTEDVFPSKSDKGISQPRAHQSRVEYPTTDRNATKRRTKNPQFYSNEHRDPRVHEYRINTSEKTRHHPQNASQPSPSFSFKHDPRVKTFEKPIMEGNTGDLTGTTAGIHSHHASERPQTLLNAESKHASQRPKTLNIAPNHNKRPASLYRRPKIVADDFRISQSKPAANSDNRFNPRPPSFIEKETNTYSPAFKNKENEKSHKYPGQGHSGNKKPAVSTPEDYYFGYSSPQTPVELPHHKNAGHGDPWNTGYSTVPLTGHTVQQFGNTEGNNEAGRIQKLQPSQTGQVHQHEKDEELSPKLYTLPNLLQQKAPTTVPLSQLNMEKTENTKAPKYFVRPTASDDQSTVLESPRQRPVNAAEPKLRFRELETRPIHRSRPAEVRSASAISEKESSLRIPKKHDQRIDAGKPSHKKIGLEARDSLKPNPFTEIYQNIPTTKEHDRILTTPREHYRIPTISKEHDQRIKSRKPSDRRIGLEAGHSLKPNPYTKIDRNSHQDQFKNGNPSIHQQSKPTIGVIHHQKKPKIEVVGSEQHQPLHGHLTADSEEESPLIYHPSVRLPNGKHRTDTRPQKAQSASVQHSALDVQPRSYQQQYIKHDADIGEGSIPARKLATRQHVKPQDDDIFTLENYNHPSAANQPEQQQGDGYGRQQYITPNVRAAKGHNQHSNVVQHPETDYNGYSAYQAPVKVVLDRKPEIVAPPQQSKIVAQQTNDFDYPPYQTPVSTSQPHGRSPLAWSNKGAYVRRPDHWTYGRPYESPLEGQRFEHRKPRVIGGGYQQVKTAVSAPNNGYFGYSSPQTAVEVPRQRNAGQGDSWNTGYSTVPLAGHTVQQFGNSGGNNENGIAQKLQPSPTGQPTSYVQADPSLTPIENLESGRIIVPLEMTEKFPYDVYGLPKPPPKPKGRKKGKWLFVPE
ncbi:unnamed protein product [Bursaphelenchus xylophilus]|uniref:(pine wood nematode) hypothetical protein n=1 Tax=Bursaphelenchus xylophilus TaxID=6326 RepID=A0A7I8XJ51_BURXY|nr:unnamed protein product [Bursaphelenchus xylophilus]CAG9121163.1 unnamed protein product [Bursaphelenchus xylophilus]